MIKVKKIHHIGIAVGNIENSLSFWNKILGLPVTKVEGVPSYKVDVAFLQTGESDIELLEPQEGNIDLEKRIQESGSGLDHLCLEVENIEGTLEELKSNGVKLINESPVEMTGRKIGFVHPSATDGVLLEFYEII